MKYIIILSILGVIIIKLKEVIDDRKYEKSLKENYSPLYEESRTTPINGAYQKRWVLSYNEKDAFKKIKAATDEVGGYVLSKVRLLDLIEPVKGSRKYKTYFYKIQAKHVDFVILDERLVARCVIELDDSSHDTADRMQRDKFVTAVLESVGYTVIHTRAITEETQQLIKSVIAVRSNNNAS